MSGPPQRSGMISISERRALTAGSPRTNSARSRGSDKVTCSLPSLSACREVGDHAAGHRVVGLGLIRMKAPVSRQSEKRSKIACSSKSQAHPADGVHRQRGRFRPAPGAEIVGLVDRDTRTRCCGRQPSASSARRPSCRPAAARRLSRVKSRPVSGWHRLRVSMSPRATSTWRSRTSVTASPASARCARRVEGDDAGDGGDLPGRQDDDAVAGLDGAGRDRALIAAKALARARDALDRHAEADGLGRARRSPSPALRPVSGRAYQGMVARAGVDDVLALQRRNRDRGDLP